MYLPQSVDPKVVWFFPRQQGSLYTVSPRSPSPWGIFCLCLLPTSHPTPRPCSDHHDSKIPWPFLVPQPYHPAGASILLQEQQRSIRGGHPLLPLPILPNSVASPCPLLPQTLHPWGPQILSPLGLCHIISPLSATPLQLLTSRLPALGS